MFRLLVRSATARAAFSSSAVALRVTPHLNELLDNEGARPEVR